MNVNAITPTQGLPSVPGVRPPTGDASGFGDLLERAIGSLQNLQGQADAAALDVATGGSAELHEAMIAIQEAQLGFQVALQVRNKLVESYQEVMRMQM